MLFVHRLPWVVIVTVAAWQVLVWEARKEELVRLWRELNVACRKFVDDAVDCAEADDVRWEVEDLRVDEDLD